MTLLHHLALSWAERDPDRAAVVHGEGTVSFGALMLRARRLAAGLHRIGVRPGDRVLIVADHAPWYVEACLAVLQAGAVVVPTCADVRPDPLRWQLDHTEAAAIILRNGDRTHVTGARRVVVAGMPGDGPGGEVVGTDELIAAGGDLKTADVSDRELAAIFYTSGTTGRPKGVMLSHRNLVANVRSIVSYLGLGPGDRAAMALPFQYVYGNSVLHTHLAAGGSIALVGSLVFPGKILRDVQKFRCTNLPAVASGLSKLLDAGLSEHHGLRFVTHAGGPIPTALLQRARGLLRSTRIVLMYGQTEAAARLTWLPPEELDRRVGSAGKPIPGVTLRVVDDHGRALPPGVVGEVIAAGDNIMAGYWKDPAETARALGPLGLRTGDLGRLDEDGYLYLVGRRSEMIKSGGHRIGPREIEEVVESLPGVSQCGVVGVPDATLDETIVAFVVPVAGSGINERAVLAQCLERLPRYKLPSSVRFIEELPRTSVGKLDRRMLGVWASQQGRRSDVAADQGR